MRKKVRAGSRFARFGVKPHTVTANRSRGGRHE